MSKECIEDRGSRAATCLERAWEGLRQILPGIPPAVIVVLAIDSRQKKRGHFAWSSWRYREDKRAHEIGISPDLFETPEALLSTLCHEAAHAMNFEREIADCGPDGYYHRTEFRSACRELGLVCEFLNSRYGWTLTRWPEPEGVPECYRGILALLQESLPLGTGRQLGRPLVSRKMPESGHVRLVCRCAEPRRIYVSRSVLGQGGIVCCLCRAPFQPAQD